MAIIARGGVNAVINNQSVNRLVLQRSVDLNVCVVQSTELLDTLGLPDRPYEYHNGLAGQCGYPMPPVPYVHMEEGRKGGRGARSANGHRQIQTSDIPHGTQLTLPCGPGGGQKGGRVVHPANCVVCCACMRGGRNSPLPSMLLTTDDDDNDGMMSNRSQKLFLQHWQKDGGACQRSHGSWPSATTQDPLTRCFGWTQGRSGRSPTQRSPAGGPHGTGNVMSGVKTGAGVFPRGV